MKFQWTRRTLGVKVCTNPFVNDYIARGFVAIKISLARY